MFHVAIIVFWLFCVLTSYFIQTLVIVITSYIDNIYTYNVSKYKNFFSSYELYKRKVMRPSGELFFSVSRRVQTNKYSSVRTVKSHVEIK